MEHPILENMMSVCPRVLLVEVINDVLNARKAQILKAENREQMESIELSTEKIIEDISGLAAEKSRMGLRYAINATGNILDINLGKAPLNEAAQKALQDVSRGYSTLETGVDRDSHIRHLLTLLTGAESGLVVNNNAAAVMLVINTIANGKEAIVSRGQLIENDGFRLPDVVARSGAKLISVGATNKTRLRDYSDAINEDTGAILKVNKSNYRIAGFSQDVPIRELAEIGKKHNIPVIDDIGGGCLIDLTQYGLPEESPAFLSIKDGADIVCFSGDEFLSGPQAGIIIGSKKCISMMRENPLYRMLRADKLILAALEATLRSYLDTDRVMKANPVLRFLSRSPEEIESMSKLLLNSLCGDLTDLATIEMEDGYSHISSVSAELDRASTKMVSIKPARMSAIELRNRLRSRSVPIFTICDGDKILMDLRAVRQDEIGEIAMALMKILIQTDSTA